MEHKILLLLLLSLIGYSADVGFTGNGFILTANTEVVECSVQTTDNTLTQCAEFTLTPDSAYQAELDCTGIKSDATSLAAIRILGLAKKVGAGAAVIEGSLVTVFDQAGATLWDTDITTSGNNMVFSVKGANATTINWTCKIELVKKI